MLVSVLFAACETKEGGDSYGGWSVSFAVENAAGDNLLDSGFEGNILGQEIFAEYEGEIFPLHEAVETRALPPAEWYGLRYGAWGGNPVRMQFGEFSASKNYRDERFTIDWGDGTTTEVKFDLFVRGGRVRRTLWIDGELVSEDSLVATIVK